MSATPTAARIIAIANPKGGSAKTTTTVNLAAGLAGAGRRVLVVDIDPQGSATQWLCGLRAEQLTDDLLCNGVVPQRMVRDTGIVGVQLVPAAGGLADAERNLAGLAESETRLRQKLNALQGWDYILIDSPASTGTLTVNAIAAADEVIAPIEASVLGLMSLRTLVGLVHTVRAQWAPALGPTRILPCRVNTRTRHAREVVEKLRDKFTAQVFTHVVRESVRLAECAGFRRPIMAYAPHSTGAEDYRNIAGEILAVESEWRHAQ